MPKVPHGAAGSKAARVAGEAAGVSGVRTQASPLLIEGSNTSSVISPADEAAGGPITREQVLACLQLVLTHLTIVTVENVVPPRPREDEPLQPFVIAQRATTASKCPVYLFRNGVVLKGPMKPEVADLVERRCKWLSARHPDVSLLWQRITCPTSGSEFLYCSNADQLGRLPEKVVWAQVYVFPPPEFARQFYSKCKGGAGMLPKHQVAVWGWKAVRGSLPAGSHAARVKDALDVGLRPSPDIMRKLFLHFCLRFILGCGDSGFHNCLMTGQGIEYVSKKFFFHHLYYIFM